MKYFKKFILFFQQYNLKAYKYCRIKPFVRQKWHYPLRDAVEVHNAWSIRFHLLTYQKTLRYSLLYNGLTFCRRFHVEQMAENKVKLAGNCIKECLFGFIILRKIIIENFCVSYGNRFNCFRNIHFIPTSSLANRSILLVIGMQGYPKGCYDQ